MLSLARPLALWAGLALLPVILLYFLRTRYNRRPVGSLYIWGRLAASVSGGTRPRRRSLLLLALQALAVLLAVGAAAGPRLVETSLARPGLALLVDVSASMGSEDVRGARPGVEDRVDLAVALAREELAALEPGTAVAAFACASGARELGEPGSSPAALAARLGSLAASDEAFDEASVSRSIEAWKAARGGEWRFLLLTDGGLDLGGARLGGEGALRVSYVGASGAGLGVGRLRVEGGLASFRAWNGSGTARKAAFALEREGVAIARAELVLPPLWSAQEIALRDASPALGRYLLRLEGGASGGPPAGASCRLAAYPRPSLTLLLVGRRNPYVEAALEYEGLSVRRSASLPAALPEGELVAAVLDGIAAPAGLACDYLSFGPEGDSWPLRAGPAVGGPIESLAPEHPLLRFVDWEGVGAEAAASLELGPGAVALAGISGSPVLASWEEGGYRRLALGVDLAASDLGLSPAFPVLLRNFLSRGLASADPSSAYALTVGEIAYRAEAPAFEAEGLLLGKSGSLARLRAPAAGFHPWRRGADRGFFAADPELGELDPTPRRLAAPTSADASQATYERRETSLEPAFLLALLLALVAEWLAWRGLPRLASSVERDVETLAATGRAFSRRVDRVVAGAAALRAAALASILIALAFPRLSRPSASRRVAVLLDVSDSVGAARAEAQRRAALRSLASLHPGDRVAVALFAGESRLVCGLSSPERASRELGTAELSAPSPGSTDLGAALSLGLAAAGRGSSLYLFSDGRSNSGDGIPEALLPDSRARILAFAEGEPSRGDSGTGLELPESARPGERVAGEWVLVARAAARVEYEVSVDGVAVARGDASLAPGRNRITFAFEAGGEGVRLVEARIPERPGSEEARASGLLSVGGARSVLVASGNGKSPIASALEAQGLAAVAVAAERVPSERSGYAGVSCLVLDDVPALALTEAQQEALVDYAAGGGGLLVVGGGESLGRGEYYATSLEEALPARTDSRRRLLFTRAKILFIVDHSGSMEEPVGGSSKQLAAMRGVAAALDGLGAQDEVGILTFDSTPTWALRFTPAGRREEALAALERLDEGGGTDLASALDEAIKGFGPPGPEKRHAILLTDGLSFEADYESLARRLKLAGVSMTTIAIGERANEGLLRDLAGWTGGGYYRARLDQVPKIVDIETAVLTRELVQEGSFALRSSASSSMAEGLAGAPPLSGYLLVKAKSLASVELEAGPSGDPLLVSWRYGAGRVAVFASDSGRRWLSPWSGLPVYNRLWAQVVRAIERPAPDGGLRATARVEDGAARVVVEARDAGQRSATGLRLAGRRSGRSLGESLSFELSETSPGRYEALVPLAGPGLAGFEVFEPGLGTSVSAWVWAPPGAELSASGPDYETLSRLSSSSGGRIVGPGEAFDPGPSWSWNPTEVRGPLALVALALLLAELCLRSLSFGQPKAAIAAFARWAKQGLDAARRLGSESRLGGGAEDGADRGEG